MRKRWIGISQIAISLVIVIGLATGCELLSPTSTPSSTPTPPSSEYPADISGHVIIAEKVKSGTAIAVPPNKEGDIFWIVDVSVKNNAYDDPVEASLETGFKGWEIIANDKVYRPGASGSPKTHPPVSVALGKTGQFMLYFVVPQTQQIDDARLCYQGQEPYSYGKLTGSDKVAVYDWDLRKVVQEVEVAPELKVADMWGLLSNWSAIIYVQLEATPTTKVGYYDIELQAGKESFVSKRVFWKEGRELMTLGWQIGIDTRAWAELSRGKKPVDVFRVEISYEPY